MLMADYAGFHEANRAEADELIALAAGLTRIDKRLADPMGAVTTRLEAAQGQGHPVDGEMAAEDCARSLRRLWLAATSASAASVYRSPDDADAARLARSPRADYFGYERDIDPSELEARCAAFFPPPPAGWRAEHLLYSSGQAGSSNAILALGADGPLTAAHHGAYFETRALLETLPGVTLKQDAPAQLLIVEPMCWNGAFKEIDFAALIDSGAARQAKAIVFDSTTLGRADKLNTYLPRIAASGPPLVLRLSSGLKLLQAGLELSNVGILSVYARTDSSALLDRLRQLRTWTGAGLRFADLLALQAPWFLDAEFTERYEQAVFAHNAALAQALTQDNHLFEPITHPALNGGVAPYCLLRLRDGDEAAYDALAERLASEAMTRKLAFAHGGSFGFRGHRFEVIKPENGEAPYLRIALGRRSGWSLYGAIALMRDIARERQPRAARSAMVS